MKHPASHAIDLRTAASLRRDAAMLPKTSLQRRYFINAAKSILGDAARLRQFP